MHIDEPAWPLIDNFFYQLAQGRSDVTVRRYARVRHRLVSFLDTADMTLGLGDNRSLLLEAERQFHDSGAFWTLYGPDELIECLPSFVHETWLPRGVGEARLQISVVRRLLLMLLRQDLRCGPGTSRAVAQAHDAIDQARLAIDNRSAHPAGTQMPARFWQQPGQKW